MQAVKVYPPRLQHLRNCKNGQSPDQRFGRDLIHALNHGVAFRKKVIFTVGQDFGSTTAIGTTATTTTYWRSRFKTGYGVQQIRFKLVCGLLQDLPGEPGVEYEPAIAVNLKNVETGVTTTKRVYFGNDIVRNELDTPDSLGVFRLDFTGLPVTRYEVSIDGEDGGRPLGVTCYEWVSPTVTDAVDYYANFNVGANLPIYDNMIEAIRHGASRMWNAGGAHLLSWLGKGDGTGVTITGGPGFTNILDTSMTGASSLTAAAPGFYFRAAGAGDGALTDLLPLVRQSQANDLPVTLAAYASSSSGSQGEVAVLDSGGTGPSVTGIGTTLQWYTADTTWNNVDSIASGKVGIFALNAMGADITVHAVSLFCREQT